LRLLSRVVKRVSSILIPLILHESLGEELLVLSLYL
jgi:hypothetical protein